ASRPSRRAGTRPPSPPRPPLSATPRRKGITAADDTCIKALLDSQAALITIVGKTWDFQVREVLNTTLEENLNMIGDSVRCCRQAGRDVFYDAEHFFDGY